VRQRSVAVVVAALVAALIVAGAGIWLYDHGRRDLIARGITVAGINVGGMHSAAAKRKLREELIAKLAQPVVVHGEGHRFVLTATQARIVADVDTAVADAIARSRRGSIFARVINGLEGTRIDANIQPAISYDQSAVKAFVNRIAGKLNRKPADATLSYSPSGISQVPGHPGIAIDTAALSKSVTAAVSGRSLQRAISIQTHPVAPKVTTKQLASTYPSVIVVNRSAFRLMLFKHLSLAKTYTIAVGRIGLETPAGLYHIDDMEVNPSWHVPNSSWAGSLAGQTIPPGPADPIKARWMGFYAGAGIHGTDDIGSLGSAASHGCIRMAIPDVEQLYNQVSIGTPVYVA
jgi:lipoprotein-anchoring transpeptidase ErfK/SrfK